MSADLKGVSFEVLWNLYTTKESAEVPYSQETLLGELRRLARIRKPDVFTWRMSDAPGDIERVFCVVGKTFCEATEETILDAMADIWTLVKSKDWGKTVIYAGAGGALMPLIYLSTSSGDPQAINEYLKRAVTFSAASGITYNFVTSHMRLLRQPTPVPESTAEWKEVELEYRTAIARLTRLISRVLVVYSMWKVGQQGDWVQRMRQHLMKTGMELLHGLCKLTDELTAKTRAFNLTGRAAMLRECSATVSCKPDTTTLASVVSDYIVSDAGRLFKNLIPTMVARHALNIGASIDDLAGATVEASETVTGRVVTHAQRCSVDAGVPYKVLDSAWVLVSSPLGNGSTLVAGSGIRWEDSALVKLREVRGVGARKMTELLLYVIYKNSMDASVFAAVPAWNKATSKGYAYNSVYIQHVTQLFSLLSNVTTPSEVTVREAVNGILAELPDAHGEMVPNCCELYVKRNSDGRLERLHAMRYGGAEVLTRKMGLPPAGYVQFDDWDEEITTPQEVLAEIVAAPVEVHSGPAPATPAASGGNDTDTAGVTAGLFDDEDENEDEDE
jgi:hypothetical protein